jgi:23S rRNA U2552 (ribose-2'-O)-methylase RlmE/FtsJ
MSKGFAYSIKNICFDENYRPSDSTRITTNFANLARGESRQENLRNALRMINSRFNAMAHWDNPKGDRYSVELEIISVDVDIEGNGKNFPTIEILKTNIIDHQTNKRIEGIVGNNLSSYVRDYDFSVLLLDHNKGQSKFTIPDSFGDLHGKLFKDFVYSDAYKENFNKLPVICLSVSDNKTYHRTENQHPVLGIEYLPNESSLTEQYFEKMGFAVRYFMPPNSVAPLAFYFFGDLLSDYTNLELISTISTMETFQKIYRPEIYNANAVAGHQYQPNLKHQDHSLTQIFYDRVERSQLAVKQGKFAEEHFIKPYQAILEQWSANCSL